MKSEQLINYIITLAKKKKILFIKEVYRNPKTPKEIRTILLEGNILGKLNNIYAYKKGLYCRKTLLGSIRQQSLIAYLSKNEPYIEKLEKQHSSLIKKHANALKRANNLEKQMGELLRKATK